MAINKQHPKFPEYNRLFQEITNEWDNERDRIKEENPDFRGFDGPVALVDKKYCLKIKELQEEYSFLFTQDTKKEAD